jgi:hypothetical protein
MLLSIFEIKFFVMRKLVSKALTNLMVHFTFLHLISLTSVILLWSYMLASCKLIVSTAMLLWGMFSTLHLFLFSWYHALLFMGA